jgi:DNA helicase-2/ATP-dependent DNA helicase PcrA
MQLLQSLEEIASQAEKANISQLTLVEKIVDNAMPDIKPSVKKKLAPFVKTIKSLRSLNEQVNSCSKSNCPL